MPSFMLRKPYETHSRDSSAISPLSCLMSATTCDRLRSIYSSTHSKQKGTSRGTAPRKTGLYWDCDPQKKRKQQEQHFIQSYEQERGSQPTEPGALMPASESSFPPSESLLSKGRLHEQHLFRAQHQARTRAKMMTITNKSTPPPP